MENKVAKPFLKWAGGKTQLRDQLAIHLPKEIFQSGFTYIEPFVGGGAVLFWLLNTFPNLKKAVINDVNESLVNAYRTIATKPGKLIKELLDFQREYHALRDDLDKRKAYYYEKRNLYNKDTGNDVLQAALLLLLNRTCFNGLFRVNRNNQFNVPIGTSVVPTICDKENILAVSQVLQKVEILQGDFEHTLHYVSDESFLFIDPPYKPLSKTANFTAYSRERFNDKEQIRLRDYCIKLDNAGSKWMLCNADLTAINPSDEFFTRLYAGFNFFRLKAKRSINANAEKRGKISELLITNYVRHLPL